MNAVQCKSMRGLKNLAAKREASKARATRKGKAAKKIPFLGVRVSKEIVKSHRYRRERGLAHSKAIASVFIGR